jgi:hypothetical protein
MRFTVAVAGMPTLLRVLCGYLLGSPATNKYKMFTACIIEVRNCSSRVYYKQERFLYLEIFITLKSVSKLLFRVVFWDI